MYKTNIFRLLSLGFLFGVESLSPAVSSLGSIIKKRLDTGVYTPVFEADAVSEKEQACVLFFTGLNSIIPGEIYGDFLTNMAEQGIEMTPIQVDQYVSIIELALGFFGRPGIVII